MVAWRRFVFIAAALLAAVLTLAYAAAYFIVASAPFQRWLQAKITEKTGYHAEARELSLRPPFRLAAAALSLEKAARPIFQAERVILTLSPLDIFSNTIHRLQLRKPTVYLDVHELFDSSSKTSMKIAIRQLNIEDGRLVLSTAAGNHLDFDGVTVNAENLNLGQTIDLNVSAQLPWLQGQMDVTIRGHEAEKIAAIRITQTASEKRSPPAAAADQSEALKAEIKLIRSAGEELEITASGKLHGLRVENENLSGSFDFKTDIDSEFKTAIFSGNISADSPPRIAALGLRVANTPVTATVKGSYEMARKILLLEALRLDSVIAKADGRATVGFGPRLVISNAQLRIRKLTLDMLKPLFPEPLRGAVYEGSAEADLVIQGPWPAVTVKGAARAEKVRIKGDDFSLAELSLTAPFEWNDGSVRADGIQVKGQMLTLNQKDRTQLAASEARFDGRLTKNPVQPWQAAGTLQLLGARFAAPDGSKIGENLAVSGRVEALTADEKGFSAKGALNIERGEVLWGTFFGDLKTARPALDYDADYVRADDSLRLRSLILSLANIGKVTVAGTVANVLKSPTARLEVKGDDLQPAGFFDFFIRETLNRRYPILDQLVLGGRGRFSFHAEGSPDDLTANGEVELRDGNLRVKSDAWQVGGVALDLPLRIHWPARSSEAPAANIPKGTLVVDSARLGSEIIPPLKASLSLWNNGLRVEQTLRIPIYGGAVEIAELAWRDAIGEPQALSLSIVARDLQLQKLTEALSWPRFGGTFDGAIPQVAWTGHSLSSQGQIQLRLFGGRMQINNMEIENPFSSLPGIKLDARFQEIDLGRASETFAFGKISGILEGNVNGLVLTDGQPAQFTADIRSTDKSGASQWISVEALNKITVLSSGNDAGTLYGGLAGLFESFRYSKLGFKASLKNDKLTLKGIESRDGKEFLVVGSFLPPTVNVVSHTQEIRFGELLRRLEQIRKSDKPRIK